MSSDYDQVRALIKEQTRTLEADDAVMSVLNTVAAVVDAATGTSVAGGANKAGQRLYSFLKGKGKEPLIPNPWFVMNGHDDNSNEYTEKYLKNRGRKSIGATVLTTAGAAASAGTGGINVLGSGVHANAVGSTTGHMMKVIAIARSYKQTRTISEWCDVVLAAKTVKAAIRGGQLIGGLIPGGSLPASVAATVAKTGVKLTMTNLCYTTAANIHWRAYQEQAISHGKGGGIGPGSRIYWEIFARRGFTRIFGAYDVAQLVREPAGWRALADKLLLI